MTSFVNRRVELAAVRRLLSVARLVTLTGVAGVGKTRLALAVGADVRRAFPDGVWLVEFARVRDEALLAHALAHAVGLHELAGDPLGSLIDFVRPRSALLILDNCEHVVGGAAALVEQVLSAAADVRALATSRELLRLGGEHEFRVAPLSVLAGDRREAAAGHAVELFSQRARAVAPAFRLDAANRADVEDVCRRLDGIPLAIELAAVRLRVLSVGQLRARLDDRFDLLTGGSPAALPHQRTLRATVDWSFELCDEAERLLWQRVSVFGGAFDLLAVEEICADLDGDAAPGEPPVVVVDGLVGKSVLVAEEHDGQLWYRLLETLRDYGRQRLRDSGEQARVWRAYGRRYLRLAERAEREWFGPGQAGWARLLHHEQPNLRDAVQHLLDLRATDDALRLCAAIWFHWLFSGRLAEGRVWLGRALAAPAEPTAARAKALYVAAFLASNDGCLPAAEPLAAEALELAERLGEQVLAAQALTRLAAIRLYRNEAEAAWPPAADAVARFEAAGTAAGAPAVLARNVLAGVRLLQADPAAAVEIYRRSIATCESAGDTTLLTATLVQVARAQWLAGELSGAAEAVRASIATQHDGPIQPMFAQAVELAAWITADAGGVAGLRQAAVVLGAADRLWRDTGLRYLREAPHFQRMHDRCVAKIRSGLGAGAFGTAFARGAEMSTADITAEITGTPVGRPLADGAGETAPSVRLTAREQEVADLIAAGLSNRQIAGKLVVSPRTAESHVQNILTKLGFSSRAQVASYLATHRRDQP